MSSNSLNRRDEQVQDPMGNPVSGVYVYVCSQPANTTTFPPSPLIALFSDQAGQNPIKNPQQTDAYGHVSYHTAAGTYTIVYYSPQIVGLQIVLPDQIITSPPFTWETDSSTNGTILGVINGVNATFTLSGVPAPAASLILSVNGIVQQGFSISGAVVTLAVPPRVGSVIQARYIVVPTPQP
jgi:hypothetical protein